MEIIPRMSEYNHEEIVFGYDKDSGLKAIIAIHDTALGPALGGTRMWPYKSETEALNDVLRLSRGMTYKAAAAGLSLGGGKGIIIGDPNKNKSEILFRAYGRLVEGLRGRYITAEDVGTSVTDMEWVRQETRYVVGLSESHGGSGDPSVATADGVYYGIKACLEEVYGHSNLDGISVAVQGLGHVGMFLTEILAKEGAILFVTDIDEKKVKYVADKFNVTSVSPEEIYDVKADVFAPCALGAIVNDQTIQRFNFKIIAGAANNQLANEDKHMKLLTEKGILYAPDYVINAGGLINVAKELEGYNREDALNRVKSIYTILKQIFKESKEEDICTNIASNRIAERRVQQVGKLRHRFVSSPPVYYKGGKIF
jgi:leucine dehydrogenase